MIHKAKRYTVYYLYFAAIVGGIGWGGYFTFEAFYQGEKEMTLAQMEYKK